MGNPGRDHRQGAKTFFRNKQGRRTHFWIEGCFGEKRKWGQGGHKIFFFGKNKRGEDFFSKDFSTEKRGRRLFSDYLMGPYL